MKKIKGVLRFLLFVYIFNFALDYFAARSVMTKEACDRYIHVLPLWYHLIAPGAPNACIDKGFFP